MENRKYKILIVDDETDVLEFLSYNLKKEGFEVFTASNGTHAVEFAQKILPHLILLDIMMPGMDGIETCERIRAIETLKHTVIAFLTARGEDYSQVAGFEAGGDDYITKPVRPKVLISRIKALLKRISVSYMDVSHPEDMAIRIDNLVIDRDKFLIYKDGREIILPKKEFLLLALLASKPSSVFTREHIFNEIWGEDNFVGDRTIDVHIRKLREKIGEEYIRTVKGVGYKYDSPRIEADQ